MLSSRSCIHAILFALAASLPCSAQTPPAEAAPVAATRFRHIDYGVRFGPSFTTLTSVETLDPTAAAAAFEPTLNFGGFATIELTESLSFQPEILFAAKGHRIRDKDAQPITTAAGDIKFPAADRVILVRYLEVPLLLRLSKRTHENTSLYAVAGPAFALRRNAVIREVVDSGRREDIVNLVNSSDLSYIAGGGVQHRRWLADARITRGMRNIATIPTPAVVKTGAFSVLLGVRF